MSRRRSDVDRDIAQRLQEMAVLFAERASVEDEERVVQRAVSAKATTTTERRRRIDRPLGESDELAKARARGILRRVGYTEAGR
jgi:hypothetical protein